MLLTNERKLLVSVTILYLIVFILLIVSESLDDWFKYDKVSACSWSGSFRSIYSSSCYTYETYGNAKCKNECPCCYGTNLASMNDMEGNSVCIIINFSILIIWIVINTILNAYKFFKPFPIYYKLYSCLYIVIGILSCFFTGSSHPSNVKIRHGYSLRLASTLLMYLIGLIHLFLSCKVIVSQKNSENQKKTITKELIESDRLEIKNTESFESSSQVRIQ